MQKPILVVMAAGMGSRYGGLKQIDPVGKNGEIIMDFSVFDALRAGFSKVVFIIKEELYADFRAVVGDRVAKYMPVEYAFQKLTDLPEGFAVPEGRVKPWGTGHAVLAARAHIDAPFAVINADDFYGAEAFAKIGEFLQNAESADGPAYTEDDGQTWHALAEDATVSMNLWGFTPDFVEDLQRGFTAFLENDVPKNPLKAEYFLPFVVNDQIRAGKADVRVLKSGDKWYGVTYKEDKPVVMRALADMMESGVYPDPLWK